MAKTPKKSEQPADDSGSGKRGTPISYRPHPKLARFLQDYRRKFRYKPSYTKVLDEALANFLRKEGFDVPDVIEEDGAEN